MKLMPLSEGKKMDYNEKNYWNDRANKMYLYKGETFYTITPIPYYYKRRKVIIDLLTKFIAGSAAEKICDYGCGDGEYLRLINGNLIKRSVPTRFFEWGGVDISDEMIEEAKYNCRLIDNIKWIVSGNGIPNGMCYDLVYSIAVFAHIDDRLLRFLFRNFAEHLSDKGSLVICEQVGARRVEGKTYIRRTIAEYTNVLEEAGFVVKEMKLIDFWAHRIFFERRIAKMFYRKMGASTYHDRQIEANRHFFFKLCSAFFTVLSKPYMFEKENGWGYVYIVAEKLNINEQRGKFNA
ncbi:MAG: class I SAM-dependent methyltransferase [bacterium]|nr:class I SAM-dependent methyltransferase [bacterium]